MSLVRQRILPNPNAFNTTPIAQPIAYNVNGLSVEQNPFTPFESVLKIWIILNWLVFLFAAWIFVTKFLKWENSVRMSMCQWYF